MGNRFKPEGAPWWAGVSKCCPQEALRDLRRALDGFFAPRQGRRKDPDVAHAFRNGCLPNGRGAPP